MFCYLKISQPDVSETDRSAAVAVGLKTDRTVAMGLDSREANVFGSSEDHGVVLKIYSAVAPCLIRTGDAYRNAPLDMKLEAAEPAASIAMIIMYFFISTRVILLRPEGS